MNWRIILAWMVFACCLGLVRLLLRLISIDPRSGLIVPLLGGLALAAFGLFWANRSWRQAGQPRLSRRITVLSGLAAGLVGWFLVPSLAFLLLLAPFPQRWGLIGVWTTTAQADRPLAIRKEFSPWGTITTYANGELRSTGHYLFLDDQTIKTETKRVPAQFTVGSQIDSYTLQLADTMLILTDGRLHQATVYQRAER
jgi:hypothetical protein